MSRPHQSTLHYVNPLSMYTQQRCSSIYESVFLCAQLFWFSPIHNWFSPRDTSTTLHYLPTKPLFSQLLSFSFSLGSLIENFKQFFAQELSTYIVVTFFNWFLFFLESSWSTLNQKQYFHASSIVQSYAKWLKQDNAHGP